MKINGEVFSSQILLKKRFSKFPNGSQSHDLAEYCLSLAVSRTCVTPKNPVYDLAHHESPIAQWLERCSQYSGGSWVRLPLGNSESVFFRVFDLRTLLHLFFKVVLSESKKRRETVDGGRLQELVGYRAKKQSVSGVSRKK